MPGSLQYNPGVANQSGALMAGGLQQLGQSIGRGIREHRRKQEDQQAAQAAIQFAIDRGMVRDEAEGKAAVKAAGGGREALAFLQQSEQLRLQQEAQQMRLAQQQATANMTAQEQAARRAALLGQPGPRPAVGPLSVLPAGAQPAQPVSRESALRTYGLRSPEVDSSFVSILRELPSSAKGPGMEALGAAYAPGVKPTDRANVYAQTANRLGIPIDPSVMQELRLANQSEPEAKTPYSRSNVYVDAAGKFIGTGVFDSRTGTEQLRTPGGDLIPIPQEARPKSPGQVDPPIPYSDFRELATNVRSSETTLTQLQRYIEAQGGTDQGLRRIANNLSTAFKTLFTAQPLTSEQLQQKMAQGQLQGIIGRLRVSVVGPGVMTEKDARRIVEYLGGDVDALQNPEVLQQALENVYRDKYREYELDRTFYNNAVDREYGSRGFRPVAEVPNLFDAAGAAGADVEDLLSKYE